MAYAKYPKSKTESHCFECKHTNEAEADGSCSAYGYNGVDCSPQPCDCRTHVVKDNADRYPKETP